MPNTTGTDPKTSPPMLDEADIGSGEKTPAQKETDEMIRQIPPLQSGQQNTQQNQQQGGQQNGQQTGQQNKQASTQQANDQSAPPDQPAITSPS